MAVRTRRLGTFAGDPPAGGTVVFTVPTDRTAILKDVVVQAQDSGAATAQLVLRTAAGQVCRFFVASMAAGAPVRAGGLFIVLQEGDAVVVYTDGAAAVNVWLSGSLLAGDPA